MILIRLVVSHFVTQLAELLLFWLKNIQAGALVLVLIG